MENDAKGLLDFGIEIRIKNHGDDKYPKQPLAGVNSIPSTGQAGGTIDVTTFSDPVKVYIPDRPDTGDMDYEYFYTVAKYNAFKEFCDGTAKDILIKYPEGEGSEYTGICQTWKNEKTVGSDALKGTLHTVPSTLIADKTAEEVTALISTTE
nr:MAG TPA: tail tube protein [Caudoviricetes sp.]